MPADSKISLLPLAKSKDSTITIEGMRESASNMIQRILDGQPVDFDKINSFCDLSHVIIESLKVEVAYKKVIGSNERIKYIEG